MKNGKLTDQQVLAIRTALPVDPEPLLAPGPGIAARTRRAVSSSVPNVALGLVLRPAIEEASDNLLRRRALLQVLLKGGKCFWGAGPAWISRRQSGQCADGIRPFSLSQEPMREAGEVLPGHLNVLAAWPNGTRGGSGSNRGMYPLGASRR